MKQVHLMFSFKACDSCGYYAPNAVHIGHEHHPQECPECGQKTLWMKDFDGLTPEQQAKIYRATFETLYRCLGCGQTYYQERDCPFCGSHEYYNMWELYRDGLGEEEENDGGQS